LVTDDKDGGGDDNEDDNSNVEFMGNNLDQPDKQQAAVDLADSSGDENIANDNGGEDSSESEDEDDDQGQNEGRRALLIRSNRRATNNDASTSIGATRRKSNRIRMIRQPDTVDFDGRTTSVYHHEDGVLHINPNVLEQAREDLKITSEILPKPSEATGDRIRLRSPRTAGISRHALNRVCLASMGMPELPATVDERVVEDLVVMHILGVVLAEQSSINKGIRLFGDMAKDSITKAKELQQLHDYVTYRPVHAHELTPEEKKQALASLIFLTEKRCGRIKTRACVNGSTQRDYIPKEKTASLTVMTDSVMITSAIDAHEGRVVATLDIPGAFCMQISMRKS
jgi:hypothetical protein